MRNESHSLSIMYKSWPYFVPPCPQTGRKWVMGAEPSRTEGPVIVRLRVTRTPQWHQILINPTSQRKAPPGPLVASLQNFPPLHLRSVCVFSALRQWQLWWGFLSQTHYGVVCLARLAAGSCRCLLAALLEAGDGPTNWIHVFEL